ncbi:XRE family transcriptional regulator [Vitreoscilla massiliensis]|uniref:XRE family transcriptional regulator n=1 Tax=Vitreoscilla massiliensis TaxID=1689272 RepID=A0ABY4E113_9NEIS|nr:hypothetical protein [Vitreoscilla massiliensis]UOO89484.1 XRE family transcriptional regulator [Vitreoscilla massiliensis]
MKFPEIGYTPNNLRTLIESTGLSQTAWAEENGYPLNRVQRWLMSTDKTSHADMQLADWEKCLLKYCKDV